MGKLLILAACAACLAAPAAFGAYRCVDDKGKSHFEDVPPAACHNVVIYEVSASGTVIRKIDPTAAATGKGEKDKDAERKASEQKRRDAALLDSYNSEGEIDMARDRNLDLIKTRLDAAKVNLERAEQRVAQVKGVAQKNPALQPDLDKAEAEKASTQATVARFEKDYEQTKVQFEVDKRRWNELKGGQKAR
jgi:hypothetical protein